MAVQPGFTIAGGGYVAEIARRGAALRGLRRDGVALTEEWPLAAKSPLAAGAILAPWPNRTEDGIYSWDGQVHRLEVTSAATQTADHGLVRGLDWDDVEVSDDAVTLEVEVGRHPGWPFDLVLRVTYSVDDRGLVCRLHARNTGTVDLPFVVGFHTYLRVGDTPVDELTLDLGAQQWQPLTDRLLPDGAPQPVAGTPYDLRGPTSLAGAQLDTPFTQASGEYTVSSAEDQVVLWTDPTLSWAQVFIADPANGKGFPGRGDGRGEYGDLGRALAVEPMSGPGNALHSGTDVARIAPGEVLTCEWGIR